VFSDPGYDGPQSTNLRDSYSLGRRKPGAPGPCFRTRDTTDLNRPIFETHILSGGESLAAPQSTLIQSLRHPGCPGSVFSDPGYYGPQSTNLRDSYSLGRRKPRRPAVHSDSISTTPCRVPRVRVFGPGIRRTSIDQSSRLIFLWEAKASPPGAPGPSFRTRDTTDLNRPIFETHIPSGGESLAATQSTLIQSLRHPAGCPGSASGPRDTTTARELLRLAENYLRPAHNRS
jgi:hypothetical protein